MTNVRSQPETMTPAAAAEALADCNLPTIDIYKTIIRVDPGYYVLLPAGLRDQIVAALRSPPVAQREAEPVAWREDAAKIIYDAFPYTPRNTADEKPPWLPGGNSHRQDDARRAADKIAALAAPPSRLDAEVCDVRWAVNVLLEKIAEKFEGWDTNDIWRSDAASTVRSFKHDLATPPAVPAGEDWPYPEGNPTCAQNLK